MEKIRRLRRIRVPAKASLWYIISGAVARSVGVVGTPLFTRLLTPEEYGLYPLFNTWLGVVTVLATLELTGGFIYRGLLRFENRKEEFLSSATALMLISFGTVSILYLLLHNQINSLTRLSTGVSIMLLLQVLSNAVLAFYTAGARYRYKYKTVALINILSAILNPIISVGIINLTPIRAEARIIGGVLVGLAVAIPLGVVIFIKGRRFFSREIWVYLLRHTLPLLPHYLSMSIILRAGEIWVGKIYGQGALGKYSVAMSLGLSMTMITGGLISALSPWMMRKLRDGYDGEISSLLLYLCRGVGLGALLILSVAPEVLSIITPADYHDAISAVYPLALTVIPMFLSSAVISAQMYFEKSGVTALPSVIAAFVSMALSAIALPYLPYTAAGIFSLIAYLVLSFLNLLGYKRVAGKYPVDLGAVARTIILISTYALLLYFMRDVFISRILLAMPILPPLVLIGLNVFKRIKEK